MGPPKILAWKPASKCADHGRSKRRSKQKVLLINNYNFIHGNMETPPFIKLVEIDSLNKTSFPSIHANFIISWGYFKY